MYTVLLSIFVKKTWGVVLSRCSKTAHL